MKLRSVFGGGVLIPLGVLLPLWVLFSSAIYTPEMVPNVQEQDSRRYVSDPEGHFAPEELRAMDQALSQLRQTYGIEAVLVVVPQVEQDDASGFTVKLFELWGLGQEERNNGLLILYTFDPSYRAVRFEVGYGLEGGLSDARSYQLITSILAPRIKEGRELEAFLTLFDEIGNILSETEEGEWALQEQATKEEDLHFLLKYLYLSLAVGVVYGAIMAGSARTKKTPAQALNHINKNALYDGGIAILFLFFPALLLALFFKWCLKKQYQKRAKNCPVCHTKRSVQMEGTAPAHLLSTKEQVEQRVGSVKFQALTCQVCGYHDVLSKVAPFSDYKKCPKCGGRTFHAVKVQHISRNKILRIYQCEYCHHTRREHITSGGGGGPIIMGGGMGGFGRGGGGFSGGSFGGGASGGGGATVRF